MLKSRSRKALATLVANIARRAGITVGVYGSESDIEYRSAEEFQRIVAGGSLPFGDGYVSREWNTKDTDALFSVLTKIIRADIPAYFRGNWKAKLALLANRVVNRQSESRSQKVARVHYDAGTDFYRVMLGETLVYTSAYYGSADSFCAPCTTLDCAQRAKLNLVCRKLRLKSGMRFLDIGCGFGELLRFAVEYYGVTAVGITNSEEHARYIRSHAKSANVSVWHGDYRHFVPDQKFDAVASIEMIEHVGHRNCAHFMKLTNRWQNEGARFLCQAIAGSDSKDAFDPWLDKNIFHGAVLQSYATLTAASEGSFRLEHTESLRKDYVRTLLAWQANIQANRVLLVFRYGERFVRMYEYYLALCAATFEAGENDVIQFLFYKGKLLP